MLIHRGYFCTCSLTVTEVGFQGHFKTLTKYAGHGRFVGSSRGAGRAGDPALFPWDRAWLFQLQLA